MVIASKFSDKIQTKKTNETEETNDDVKKVQQKKSNDDGSLTWRPFEIYFKNKENKK